MSDAVLPPTSRAWRRRLWALAWPVMLSNSTVPLVGAVDTAVVGHGQDPASVGAVAIGALIFTCVAWLCGFLRMSTTGFIAQAWGAGELADVQRHDRACPASGLAAGAGSAPRPAPCP